MIGSVTSRVSDEDAARAGNPPRPVPPEAFTRAETYRATRLPVDFASTLIPDAYVSPEFHELELERIFAAYVQLNEKSEGVGLGLSLVRKNADQLGHNVSVRSVPGRGTRFSIELPVEASPAAKAFALATDLRRRADLAHGAAEEAHVRADRLHQAVDASVQHESAEQPEEGVVPRDD